MDDPAFYIHDRAFRIFQGRGPFVAAAIHDGHAVRLEVGEALALSSAEQLREEDPYTAAWTAIAPTRIVGLRSRFEVDLNRPREKAVYIEPADAWGLNVWKAPPADALIARSLAEYDAFYAAVNQVLSGLVKAHGRVLVFDLHTYNHRRGGPQAAPDDPQLNPEINLGTGTLDRQFWSPVVEACLSSLRSFDFAGRRLDVRENVKFQGGWFPRWIHQTFAGQVCALAIEVKKFFMDEWTGAADDAQLRLVRVALEQARDAVLASINP